MALFDPDRPCPICGCPLVEVGADPEAGFATTYWAIEDPQFTILDDSVVHRSCLAGWPQRDLFVAYYNQHCRDELWVDRNGNVQYAGPLRRLIRYVGRRASGRRVSQEYG